MGRFRGRLAASRKTAGRKAQAGAQAEPQKVAPAESSAETP
jgi:hypothetical protein